MSFVLTPAESKRLIAKGIASCKPVKRALKSGIVAVAKGTTNGYVAEELSGEPIEKTRYCTGTTTPLLRKRCGVETSNELPDLVYRDGQRWEGVSAVDAAGEMGAGDVFIKGSNAINYERGQAGILIGHPTGGTIGAVIGTLTARGAVLLLAVGLEKNIPGDLCKTARTVAATKGGGPALWPVNGEIFTEIEALRTLCAVEAVVTAAGGILGAEGSVRFSVHGLPERIEQVSALLGEIQGEPPFGGG